IPLRPYGWQAEAELGGGWILAWASHMIDQLRWIVGEISEASALRSIRIPERPDARGELHRCTAEDSFTATLRTSNGVTVSIDSTSAASANVPSRLTFMGSKAV